MRMRGWEDIDWSSVTPGDYATDAASWATDWAGVVSPEVQPQSDWVTDLSKLALAAIQVNAAYRATQAPPRTATTQGGLVKTGNADGTLTVRNPATGQTAITKPEVGVPYVLTDGRTIINQGNGSYTLILPDGSTQTRQYPSAAGGGFSLASVPPAVWVGAAALGLLMLRKA